MRIEDTDTARSEKSYVNNIIKSLSWLGIDWDNEIVYQSKRGVIYEKYIAQLLLSNKAYKCYCSKERLNKIREEQRRNKQKPKYDGFCRDRKIESEGSYVIRLKNNENDKTFVNDIVHGKIEFQNKELDDLILMRSDGSPTYNFASVIDDNDMGISHIIRGDDHTNNAPRQLQIYKALGFKEPKYVHLPMILDANGKKMSKSNNDFNLINFINHGYIPHAVLNYLLRLGWSSKNQEIFSLEEILSLFSLKKIQKSPSYNNFDKLNWLNKYYLKKLPLEKVMNLFITYLNDNSISIKNRSLLEEIIILQKTRCNNFKEIVGKSVYLIDMKSYKKKEIKDFLLVKNKIYLKQIICRFNALLIWKKELIYKGILEVIEKNELEKKNALSLVRLATIGEKESPPVAKILEIIGKKEVINRLTQYIK